jgi:hypothetical protein
MFAETANVAYSFPFADQGKQTSVFRLQKTNKYAVSVYQLQ